jgi:hypothetical protein
MIFGRFWMDDGSSEGTFVSPAAGDGHDGLDDRRGEIAMGLVDTHSARSGIAIVAAGVAPGFAISASGLARVFISVVLRRQDR